jgi:hypothetical protein
MASARSHFVRRVGILCTVGLLLLPVVLSGHGHEARASHTDTCALCVATHCSPATTAPPIPQPAAPLALRTRIALERAPLVSRSQPLPSGRAPPPPALLRAV